MGAGRRRIFLLMALGAVLLMARSGRAQGLGEPAPDPAANVNQHEQMQMNMPMNTGWELMQYGVVYAIFNHQGGPRGGNEFVAPNWWMGMANRELSRGRLTLTTMLSL